MDLRSLIAFLETLSFGEAFEVGNEVKRSLMSSKGVKADLSAH